MNKKTWKIIVTCCFLSLTLFGCKQTLGTSEDSAIAEEKEENVVENYTFGFSAISMENPYYITLEASIRKSVEALEDTLISTNPNYDSDLQCEQIYELIDQGIDAIFLSPVDWVGIQPAIDALTAANVKIINIDSEIKDKTSVDAFIGSNNKEIGIMCGEKLIEEFPDGGKIVILECPTMNSINDRITGFEETIAEKGFEVIERVDVHGSLEEARVAVERILEEQEDIVAIMCGNDPIALGALVSLNASESTDVKIISVDGSPDLKKELEKIDTPVLGTVAQSPISMGKTAVEVALKVLNGEEYEKVTYEEAVFIDQENVIMYGVDGWQ